MRDPFEHVLDTAEAAALVGIGKRAVGQWCRDGLLGPGARQVGREWIIDRESLLRVAADPPKPGRRAKKDSP